jgi:hypothetical protein
MHWREIHLGIDGKTLEVRAIEFTGNSESLISVCRDGVPVLGIIDLPVPRARYAAVEGFCCTNRVMGGLPLSLDRLIPRPL